jgi:hypothetical protein
MAAGRKTGGRVKGVQNKLTPVRKSQIKEAIENSDVTPLEVMLAVMNGTPPAYSDRQFEAAKAAAPYVHPRKVDHGEDRPANNTTVIIGGVTDADRIEAVRQLLGKKT